jgi:hypothetical protein
MKTKKNAVPSIPKDRASGAHAIAKAQFPDDPRRLYRWQKFITCGTDVVESLAKMRKDVTAMWLAAHNGDSQELINAYLADLIEALDKADDDAGDVVFMAKEHQDFGAAHSEEFPVETSARAKELAEETKVAS